MKAMEETLGVADALDRYGIPYRDVNPFDHPDMAAQYRVRSVPMVVVVEGDFKILRMVGYKPEIIEQISVLFVCSADCPVYRYIPHPLRALTKLFRLFPFR